MVHFVNIKYSICLEQPQLLLASTLYFAFFSVSWRAYTRRRDRVPAEAAQRVLAQALAKKLSKYEWVMSQHKGDTSSLPSKDLHPQDHISSLSRCILDKITRKPNNVVLTLAITAVTCVQFANSSLATRSRGSWKKAWEKRLSCPNFIAKCCTFPLTASRTIYSFGPLPQWSRFKTWLGVFYFQDLKED